MGFAYLKQSKYKTFQGNSEVAEAPVVPQPENASLRAVLTARASPRDHHANLRNKFSKNSGTEASGLGKLRNVLPAVHVECREKNSDADHNTTAKMNAEARWESVDLLALCFNM